MHLSRWSLILPIAIALTACTDSLDPKTVPGSYGLNDINGRTLPTYEAPTPGATRTINGASLSLDVGVNAELIQDVTEFGGTRHTITTNYTYRIKDHDLIFDFSPPCAADANCVSPPTGKITANGDIDLEMGGGGISIIYHLQHITLAY